MVGISFNSALVIKALDESGAVASGNKVVLSAPRDGTLLLFRLWW